MDNDLKLVDIDEQSPQRGALDEQGRYVPWEDETVPIGDEAFDKRVEKRRKANKTARKNRRKARKKGKR
jgi:hypothetical protein